MTPTGDQCYRGLEPGAHCIVTPSPLKLQGNVPALPPHTGQGALCTHCPISALAVWVACSQSAWPCQECFLVRLGCSLHQCDLIVKLCLQLTCALAL